MFDNVRADTRRLRETLKRPFPWYVLEGLLLDAGYQAVLLYRLAHWLKRRKIPVLPALVARLNQMLTGADLAPASEIGPGLRLPHPAGVVIGAYVRIGREALLMQGVTLGAPHLARIHDMPTLGERVTMGAYSAAIGKVEIGNGASIGAHVLVTEPVPPGARIRLDSGRAVLSPERNGDLSAPHGDGSTEASSSRGMEKRSSSRPSSRRRRGETPPSP